MNNFILVANWKSNYPQNWSIDVPENINVLVAPPFPLLSKIKNYSLCSQDVSQFPEGSYTGEVSAKLLANLGIKYSLVGHSERRKLLKETNLEIENKIKQLLAENIIPIICAQTIDEIPNNIRNYNSDQYIIMYEPSSAISTDGNYHPETPEKIQSVITDWQTKLHLKCQFLYGGSVNKEFISQLLTPNSKLSGLVIGHASLDATSFNSIIKECKKSLA